MPETRVTTSEKNCNVSTVRTTTQDTVTTTQTDNHTKTRSETVTVTPDETNTLIAACPCGRFDLDKLAEESRREAFKSSNIALAISNSIAVFTLLILQEILKNQCKTHRLNLNTVFLITSAIAGLVDGVIVNNPAPFNS